MTFKRKYYPQHCISVMRAEWLNMNISASYKLYGRQTMNCSETRTTLILDRWHSLSRTVKNDNYE